MNNRISDDAEFPEGRQSPRVCSQIETFALKPTIAFIWKATKEIKPFSYLPS